MESLGGFGYRSLVFASFWSVICIVKIQGNFWSSLVQIFKHSNLNSKLHFGQIPVVISKLSIYGIFIYISV